MQITWISIEGDGIQIQAISLNIFYFTMGSYYAVVIMKLPVSLKYFTHCTAFVDKKSFLFMYLVLVCWVNSSRRLKMVSRAFLNSNSRTATLSSLWFPVQCESSEFLVKSKRDKSSQIWEPQIEDWIRFHLFFARSQKCRKFQSTVRFFIRFRDFTILNM